MALITCSGSTVHYASGCALLLAYDKDNDGIIIKSDVEAVVDDTNAGIIAEEEGAFVVLCYLHDGNINAMCPGCYVAGVTITFVTKKEDGTELTGVSVFVNGDKKGET